MDGNLLYFESESVKAKYEYYDYPNTIRQEILSPQAIQWTFRDSYLGKFSTNLIKKITFPEFGLPTDFVYVLDFSYEFDKQKRVSKMFINRNDIKTGIACAKFEYTFSY